MHYLYQVEKIIKQIPGKRNVSTPGWNDHVKNVHMAARNAYLLWKDIDKPRLGVVYDHVRVKLPMLDPLRKICFN